MSKVDTAGNLSPESWKQSVETVRQHSADSTSILTRRSGLVVARGFGEDDDDLHSLDHQDLNKEFVRWASQIENIAHSYTSSLASGHVRQQPKDEFLYMFALNSVMHILLGLSYLSLHMYLDYNAETFARWPNGIYCSIPALGAGLIGVSSVTNVLELHSKDINHAFLICSAVALVFSIAVVSVSPFGHVGIASPTEANPTLSSTPFLVWSNLDQSLFIVAWLELVVAIWSIILGLVTVSKFCRAQIGGYVDVELDLTNSVICLGPKSGD